KAITITTSPATALPVGTYHATVTLSGARADNSPVTLSVTVIVRAPLLITYGRATEKIQMLNVGAAASPFLSVTTTTGAPTTDSSLAFVSRTPSVAAVNAAGRLSGVGAGEGWIVATSTNGLADSVFAIVPRSATGPV